MDYQFREIRKGERADVLERAKAQGCTIQPDTLRHHLSLTAEKEGQIVALALCLEQEDRQFVIEIVPIDPAAGEALSTELADRCLRKAQAQAIGAARLSSPTPQPTQTIWEQTNWLDGIGETPPPGEPASGDQATQAA